jgi:4-hydroxy-3-polyprenylbenzoate decarboxylase
LPSTGYALAMNTVVGITGASGIVYGLRLLESLPGRKTVIVSEEAERIADVELGVSKREMISKADAHYENDDLFSPLASGSVSFDSMAIVPCSTSTMSKIACGISDNLVTRVASVALKERRKLVLLIRETPLSAIHLENMHKLSLAGAVIMPACPAFYPEPKSVGDMVDFVVGRVLDELGVDNDLYKRWSGKTRRSTGSRAPRRTRR